MAAWMNSMEKAGEQLEDDKIYLTTNTSLAGSYRFLYGKMFFC